MSVFSPGGTDEKFWGTERLQFYLETGPQRLWSDCTETSFLTYMMRANTPASKELRIHTPGVPQGAWDFRGTWCIRSARQMLSPKGCGIPDTQPWKVKRGWIGSMDPWPESICRPKRPWRVRPVGSLMGSRADLATRASVPPAFFGFSATASGRLASVDLGYTLNSSSISYCSLFVLRAAQWWMSERLGQIRCQISADALMIRVASTKQSKTYGIKIIF